MHLRLESEERSQDGGKNWAVWEDVQERKWAYNLVEKELTDGLHRHVTCVFTWNLILRRDPLLV